MGDDGGGGDKFFWLRAGASPTRCHTGLRRGDTVGRRDCANCLERERPRSGLSTPLPSPPRQGEGVRSRVWQRRVKPTGFALAGLRSVPQGKSLQWSDEGHESYARMAGWEGGRGRGTSGWGEWPAGQVRRSDRRRNTERPNKKAGHRCPAFSKYRATYSAAVGVPPAVMKAGNSPTSGCGSLAGSVAGIATGGTAAARTAFARLARFALGGSHRLGRGFIFMLASGAAAAAAAASAACCSRCCSRSCACTWARSRGEGRSGTCCGWGWLSPPRQHHSAAAD